MSLSSSEAEFYACSEAVKEIPFIVQILMFLGVTVELPIKVLIDNVGAIFMSENTTSSDRTRHMDTRYRFVEQLQDEGLIKVGFVRSEKNCSDLNTKNVSREILESHQPMIMADKEYAAIAAMFGGGAQLLSPNRKGVEQDVLEGV